MRLQFNEKEAARELGCYKIEVDAKPDLMVKTIDNENTLCIVVDMINGFCKSGNLASPRLADVIRPVRELLQKLPNAQKAFIRDCHSANETAEFKWFPPHCHTKKESALADELKGFGGIDIPKNSTNGFFALMSRIPELNKYANMIVVGVCTDICVMQLALSLRAYLNENNSHANVITFTDCIDTYHSPVHNAELSNLFALRFMEQAGVQVFKNVI
ncbi:MAG: isochorismatase family protein [Firmicutes bacterium]|nr:isochorismatase family protein [Bacillota bacterium]